MDKQNLYPILSSVKYNKVGQNDKVKKFGNMHEISAINQRMVVDFNSIDTSDVSVNPILNDDNDSIIDGLFEKNQILQARWRVMQQQIDNLKRENEHLNDQLSEEKNRCAKYQKKLQYIQENQPVFEKLKQAYLSLKYNEHANRSCVEVQERSCQTYKNNCETETSSQTFEEYAESEKAVQVYRTSNIDIRDIIDCAVEPGYMPVKKKEFLALKQTVETLKTLIISEPLATFVISEQREAKYRKDIAELFMDNRNLKQLVVEQQLELDSAKQQLALKKSSKETNMLKKIIAKMEKQIRSCNICTVKLAEDEDSKTDLNEKEKKIVEHISVKYELKQQQKQESSLEPFDYKTPRTGTPYFTPRSARTDGADTFRSCEDNISFDSV